MNKTVLIPPKTLISKYKFAIFFEDFATQVQFLHPLLIFFVYKSFFLIYLDFGSLIIYAKRDTFAIICLFVDFHRDICQITIGVP